MARAVGPGPGMGVLAQHARHNKVLLLLVAIKLVTLQVVIVRHVQSESGGADTINGQSVIKRSTRT